METIGAFAAKTRLSELLDRAERGETFQITKHGRPVARIVPESEIDEERKSAAVERLKAFRGQFAELSLEQLLELRHEGHRY